MIVLYLVFDHFHARRNQIRTRKIYRFNINWVKCSVKRLTVANVAKNILFLLLNTEILNISSIICNVFTQTAPLKRRMPNFLARIQVQFTFNAKNLSRKKLCTIFCRSLPLCRRK